MRGGCCCNIPLGLSYAQKFSFSRWTDVFRFRRVAVSTKGFVFTTHSVRHTGIEKVNKIIYPHAFVRYRMVKGWFPYDRGSQIANNRNWSQTIAGDRTWFYLLRSSAITIAGSQTIAEVVSIWSQTIADLIAICDLRSAIIWKPAFR